MVFELITSGCSIACRSILQSAVVQVLIKIVVFRIVVLQIAGLQIVVIQIAGLRIVVIQIGILQIAAPQVVVLRVVARLSNKIKTEFLKYGEALEQMDPP